MDPGKRRFYGFFVVPRPGRAVRVFGSHRAGPGPSFVEQKALFREPR